MSKLDWEYYGEGSWQALSLFHDQGVQFVWAIDICEDGSFSVGETDSELTAREGTFHSLTAAKEWCNKEETELLK